MLSISSGCRATCEQYQEKEELPEKNDAHQKRMERLTRPVVPAEIGDFFRYCILPFGIYSQEIKCPSESMAGGLVAGPIG